MEISNHFHLFYLYFYLNIGYIYILKDMHLLPKFFNVNRIFLSIKYLLYTPSSNQGGVFKFIYDFSTPPSNFL